MNWSEIKKYSGSKVVITLGNFDNNFGSYYLPISKFSQIKEFIEENFKFKNSFEVKQFYLRNMKMQISKSSQKEYFIKDILFSGLTKQYAYEVLNINTIEEDVFPPLEKYHNETVEQYNIFGNNYLSILLVSDEDNNYVKISFNNSKESRNECKKLLKSFDEIM